MPSGAEGFRRKQEQKAANAAASDYGPRADFFSVKDGQKAIVRFLEQGDQIVYADSHRIPVAGSRYPRDMICLDQDGDGTPCPACQSETDTVRRRSTKGFINVIWREGPVYERNDYGSPKKDANGNAIITGRADGVFLWKCSATVLEMLFTKDAKYKGLMSRDFEVSRTGSTMQNTKYAIDPADVDGGPQPLTVADQMLVEKKYDLAEFTRPLDYAAAVALVYGAATQTAGPQETMDRSQVATAENVFSGGSPVRSSAFSRG